MKIVYVVSELFLYVKIGGLVDVVGLFCVMLVEYGYEVLVFIFGYWMVVDYCDVLWVEKVMLFKIEMGDGFMSGDVWMFLLWINFKIYLICWEEFFDCKGLYGNGECDYEDNYYCYIFFCKGVVEMLWLVNLWVDIVYVYDW